MTALNRKLRTFLMPYLKLPRQFHAFGVGMPRSGTTSLARFFEPHYRAAHEPEWDRLIPLIIDVQEGRTSSDVLDRYVLTRDRRLRLEMDVSHLNYWIIESLVTQFPEARYVFTIRDPFRWVESVVNSLLFRNRPKAPSRQRLQDIRYGGLPADDPEIEACLTDLGLPSLNGFLGYWSTHNRKILKTVPTKQLLVIRTEKLSDSLGEIAEFLEVPSETLNQDPIHLNKGGGKSDVLSSIDPVYMDAVLKKHCKDLIDELFPDYRIPTGQS